MTSSAFTLMTIGCILVEIIVGMILILGLHNLFPKASVNRLAYLSAGLFSIFSAIYSNPSSFPILIIMAIIGTVLWGTIFAGLWRLITSISNKRRKVQISKRTSEQEPTGKYQASSETITCPACGFEQAANNNYCRKCGTILPA
jgi:hypothetical protein